ncbi:MAG: hypothetical protein WCV90_06915 [Candidatus Woesearchaeota archaeon]
MIERAIEHWLINTNERNYQIPFCQVLIARGFEILYISPHGQLEFGKDIIAKDPNNNVWAYQLKTGNITLSVYDKIQREINDLMQCPCDHPNIDKKIPHKSYLVTNGDIKDDVFQRIDKINSTNKVFSQLETINKDQLLKMFLDQQGIFLPKSFEGFGKFLHFFTKNGADFFPKKEFFQFISEDILIAEGQKSNKLNSIYSSVILTSYLLKNYQKMNNFFAQFEAWSVLLSTLIKYIEENSIIDSSIIQTLKLIRQNIDNTLQSIVNEFNERDNFLEGESLGDGKDVYRARVTILLGLVSLHSILNKDYNEKTKKKVIENLKFGWYWGESAFPYWFYIIKYLEKQKENKISDNYLKIFLEATLSNNGIRNKLIAYSNPYYDVSNIFNAIFNIEPIDFNQFKGRSYAIEPLISMITRRDKRDLLEDNWRKISHIQFEKFMADSNYDLFNFWNKHGTNHSEFPVQKERWSNLKLKYDTKVNNDFLEKYKLFLPFFFIVTQHRINEEIVRLLDIEF